MFGLLCISLAVMDKGGSGGRGVEMRERLGHRARNSLICSKHYVDFLYGVWAEMGLASVNRKRPHFRRCKSALESQNKNCYYYLENPLLPYNRFWANLWHFDQLTYVFFQDLGFPSHAYIAFPWQIVFVLFCVCFCVSVLFLYWICVFVLAL